MNLYNSMKLKPQTAQGAAASVFGVQSAHGPQANAPVVPDVSVLFSKAGVARATLNPQDGQDTFGLGQYGVGLNGFSGGGFGSFGVGAGLPVVGTLEFSQTDSYNDFFSHSGDGGWNSGLSAEGLTYDGPSAGLLAQANTGFAAASAAADADPVTADGLFQTQKQITQQHIDTVDQLNPKGISGGRPVAVETQRVNAMKAIKVDLTNWNLLPAQIQTAQAQLAAATAAAAPPPATGVSTTPGTYTAPTSAVAPVNNTAYLTQLNTAAAAQAAEQQQIAQLQQQNAALAVSTGADTAAAPASGLPDWLLPVGAGVVVLGVVGFVLLRKKKG